MSLTLYYNPQSRASTMHWLLEEIGVDYEIASVDFEGGSMRDPEFLALNPMGKIPVIVDDGAVVTETVAIAIYLCDKYKTPNDLSVAIDDPRRIGAARRQADPLQRAERVACLTDRPSQNGMRKPVTVTGFWQQASASRSSLGVGRRSDRPSSMPCRPRPTCRGSTVRDTARPPPGR